VKLNNASARSADLPTGLSNVKGDLVFDANRLFFENVTGEAGGGILALSGSVNYSEKAAAIRYLRENRPHSDSLPGRAQLAGWGIACGSRARWTGSTLRESSCSAGEPE